MNLRRWIMKFAALLMMGVSLGLACPAVAQTGREGVQSFQQGGDSWRRAEEDNHRPAIKDIQLTTWPLPVFAALLKTT